MNGKRLWAFPVVLSVLVLTSCSGLPPGAAGGGGGAGNNTTLTLTMISQGQIRPGNFTILAWSAEISSLSITDSSGNATNLPLSPSPYPVDLNRLSTDTAVLGAFTVPAAVSFPTMTVAFTNFSITIHNESGGLIGASCGDGDICEFSPAPATVPITASLSFIAGTTKNTYLTVFPSNIITVGNAGLNLVFNQNTPISVQSTVRAGLPANAVDTVEDFTGMVTAVSGSSISIATGVFVAPATTGPALSAKFSGTIAFDDDSSPACGAGTIAGCVKVGSIVSMDGVVNTDGSITATEIDLLNATPVDALEGSIFSTGPGAFAMVVTDKQVMSANTTLAAANIGDIFTVNGLNTAAYSVDTKNLTTANPPVPINLFTSSGDILNGQTLRLHVTAATGAIATNDQTLTTDNAQLRFTRFTANASNASNSIFDVTDLGSFFQVGNQSVVQTYPVTILDGTSTGLGGIADAVAPLASIRALFLNSQDNFYATKARHQ